MPSEEAKKVWALIVANGRILDACEGPHDFVPIDKKPILGKVRCTKCGGTLSSLDARWYERGLNHGRKCK